jgi:hypothetical protein
MLFPARAGRSRAEATLTALGADGMAARAPLIGSRAPLIGSRPPAIGYRAPAIKKRAQLITVRALLITVLAIGITDRSLGITDRSVGIAVGSLGIAVGGAVFAQPASPSTDLVAHRNAPTVGTRDRAAGSIGPVPDATVPRSAATVPATDPGDHAIGATDR